MKMPPPTRREHQRDVRRFRLRGGVRAKNAKRETVVSSVGGGKRGARCCVPPRRDSRLLCVARDLSLSLRRSSA
jgi:hypothetical protein